MSGMFFLKHNVYFYFTSNLPIIQLTDNLPEVTGNLSVIYR